MEKKTLILTIHFSHMMSLSTTRSFTTKDKAAFVMYTEAAFPHRF